MLRNSLIVILTLIAGTFNTAYSQNDKPIFVESWVTNPDRSALFQKQPDSVFFRNSNSGWGIPIVVDDKQQFQEIDGFGFALTGGSAELLMKMSAAARAKLLQELFTWNHNNIGISYIRLSIGSSDMNRFVFSYDDVKEGETDFDLKKFSLSQDLNDVIPVMKEILTINPGIKILGSPWSAPEWMKTNNNVRGGALKKECYDVYAMYFVKYIQEMKNQGITLDAITIQNEPLNSKNTPSMQWLWTEQAEFIKNNLGPAIVKAGLTTKIILFDHNLDRIDYPLAMLNDPDVAKYADGSAFHHYGGEINSMSNLHLARPDKNLYFTEQMVVENPADKTISISEQVLRLIVGTTRSWSKNVILWNLAADPKNDPHTDHGGCSMCQGAITIDGENISRNIAYYTIAHASKFVRPGSVRVASTYTGDKTVSLTEDEEHPGIKRVTLIENTQVLPNVTFRTPDGKIVIIVVNDTWSANSFSIRYRGKFAGFRLSPGAVGTYVWRAEG
ncbi:MAG: glycoside hydrolase family 30 beta sandwich domain-containing protein [Bacteroidota bacterium]